MKIHVAAHLMNFDTLQHQMFGNNIVDYFNDQ